MFAPATALPAEYAPSMLLRPEHGVVPFSGRQAEIADLAEWSSGGAAIAARLITGPGGQGKTRLALRLCDLLRAEGWLAGVVSEVIGTGVTDRLARISAPVLLVIDYAESQTERLLDLAASLVERPPDQPTRLLLIARSAGEWLTSLHEHADDRVAGVFLAAAEHVLLPLARGTAARHAEFTRALRSLADRLGCSYEDVDPPPGLGSERFSRVHARTPSCGYFTMSGGTGGEPLPCTGCRTRAGPRWTR